MLSLFPTLSLAIDSSHVLGIDTGAPRQDSPERDLLHPEPVGQPQDQQQGGLQDQQQGDLQDHQQGNSQGNTQTGNIPISEQV